MTTSVPRELQDTPGFARGFLRAHLKLIFAFAALVTVGAAAASYAQPDAYTSVARVVVESKLLPSGGVPPLPDMGTEKAVALSGAVTEPAAQALDLTQAQAVQGVTVSGGEATAQWRFVRDLFTSIRADRALRRLTTYVDTNGHALPRVWDALLPVTDGEASSGLESFGDPGPGRWVTLYASADHVFMYVAGLRWDTHDAAGPGDGSAGIGWHPLVRSSAGFVARHPEGL